MSSLLSEIKNLLWHLLTFALSEEIFLKGWRPKLFEMTEPVLMCCLFIVFHRYLLYWFALMVICRLWPRAYRDTSAPLDKSRTSCRPIATQATL